MIQAVDVIDKLCKIENLDKTLSLKFITTVFQHVTDNHMLVGNS